MRPFRVVGCTWAVFATAATLLAEEPAPATHRVRAEMPSVAALIDVGMSRSKTFAALVAAVDQTDGLVYVEEGTCGFRVRACLAMSLVLSGPNRMLRIQVRPRRATRESIAAIGHELQHVLEVLRQPGIRSSAALLHFFLREAPTARETFETAAAVRTGMTVFAELAADK